MPRRKNIICRISCRLADDNIPEACRLSGLSQSRLYALLKKHRIARHD